VEKVQQAELPAGWEREIIVVDDGSGPETVAVLHTIEDRAHIIYRPQNNGKGAVVKAGLQAAQGDYCIIQDADLELDPSQYHKLFEPLLEGKAEAVFGYRILEKQGSVTPMLFYGGLLLSFLYDIAFFTRFRDIPCCYKLFPRRCIPALLETPSEDFVFDAVELTYVIEQQCSVAQVPVVYRPRSRAQGKKLKFEHGVQCIVAIVLLRLGLHKSPIAFDMGRISRFVIAGAITAFVNLGTLYTLTEYVHVWYLFSSIAAFIVSYSINFSLQKFWTFKNSDTHAIRYQLPLHVSLALFNLLFNTMLIFIFVEWARLWYVAAQIIAAVIIALDSFYFSRKIFS